MKDYKKKFPVGTVVRERPGKYSSNQEFVVIEWEPFAKKFKNLLKSGSKEDNDFVPVREANGNINGYTADNLIIVKHFDGPEAPKEKEIDTIEI